MDAKPFCVYNRTNESFLSLGVTVGGGLWPWGNILRKKSTSDGNEGRWITKLGGLCTLGLLASRDLVYLDSSLTVIAIVEDLPAHRLAPIRATTQSILELPAHSIASSQTSVGHQLVICAAEEMEFRLRSMPQPETGPLDVGVSTRREPRERMANGRRTTRRIRWPRLVAYDEDGDAMSVHGVRDISASGLYLMTGERWPIGAHICMTLQRADGLDDLSMVPIRVDLRVTRWGTDGMGLEFLQANDDQVALVAMHAR
jgi:hypothetical protein